MTVIPRHGYDSERDDYLVPPPELPHVPEPTVDPAYGWGMDHLVPWRERERLLATWAIEEAHAEAIASMGRDVQLVAARTERDRALRALGALDAPTIPITPVPESAEPDPPTPSTPPAPSARPEEGSPPAEPSAMERAEQLVRDVLDRGEPMPTLKKINDLVGKHGYIKGPHVAAWRRLWEREQA